MHLNFRIKRTKIHILIGRFAWKYFKGTIMNAFLKDRIITACDTARKFASIYYEYLDVKRNKLRHQYAENGLLVWNGNGIKGNEAIQNYISTLPNSEHTVLSVDSQPFPKKADVILVQVAGTVKYQANHAKPFTQTFTLQVYEDNWKIINDCYRFVGPLKSAN